MQRSIAAVRRSVEALRWRVDGPGHASTRQQALIEVESALAELRAAEQFLRQGQEGEGARLTVPAPVADGREFFANAFRHAPIGMVLIGLDGRPWRVNTAMCRMLGYAEEELLDKSVFDITHPEDMGVGVECLGRLLAGEIPSGQFEKRYFHRDGHMVWALLNLSLMRATDGEPLCVVAQVQDITERKRHEAALRESEERFRKIFVEGPLGMAFVAPDHRLVKVNERLCQIVGYTEEELTGLSFTDITYPEDVEKDVKLARRVFAGEIPFYQMEKRYVRKDGDIVWVHLTASVIHDGEGRPLVGLAMVEDINEHKRIEMELREREANFRGIVEHMDDIFYRVGLDGTVQMVGPAVAEYGYRPEDLIGTDSRALFVDPAERDRNVRAILEDGVVRDSEITVKRRDGSPLPASVSAHALRDAAGRVVAVEGVLRDISERKRIEREMRQKDAELRRIIDNIQDVFYRLSLNGTMQLVSDSAAQFGYRTDELIGMNIRDLFPDAPEPEQIVQALREQGAVRDFELTVRRKDGTPVPVSASVYLLRDAGGQEVGVEGVVRDVTERKRAEEATRQHDLELAHVLRLSVAGEMAASLAHELGQPLAAIANYTHACALRVGEGMPGAAGLPETMRRISAEVARAGEIIERLRLVVRRAAPAPEDVDVNERVAHVVRFLGTEARERGVEIQLDLAPDLPVVKADGIEIEQVLFNLVKNGFEAMEGVEVGRRKLAVRTWLASSRAIEISVCDWGVGFSRELAAKLFEPLFTTKAGGTGIGLTISRSIVAAHGGHLRAALNPEGGAVVSFTLPVKRKGAVRAK